MRFAFSRGWFDWGNPPHPWLTVQQWLTEILPELSNGLSNRRFHQLESRDICFRRVLILCIKPSTRNRVSWKAINSYLYYLSKKPGFSSPQLTPIIRNRVSWKAPKSYLYYAPKKPGFSSPQSTPILRNRVSSLRSTVIFIMHQRNPVSYPQKPGFLFATNSYLYYPPKKPGFFFSSWWGLFPLPKHPHTIQKRQQ